MRMIKLCIDINFVSVARFNGIQQARSG